MFSLLETFQPAWMHRLAWLCVDGTLFLICRWRCQTLSDYFSSILQEQCINTSCAPSYVRMEDGGCKAITKMLRNAFYAFHVLVSPKTPDWNGTGLLTLIKELFFEGTICSYTIDNYLPPELHSEDSQLYSEHTVTIVIGIEGHVRVEDLFEKIKASIRYINRNGTISLTLHHLPFEGLPSNSLGYYTFSDETSSCPEAILITELQFCEAAVFSSGKYWIDEDTGLLHIGRLVFVPGTFVLRTSSLFPQTSAHVCLLDFLEKRFILSQSTLRDVVSKTCGAFSLDTFVLLLSVVYVL